MPVRLLSPLLSLALLGGCAAVASVESASRPLDAYELTPVPAAQASVRGTRSLVVEVPSTSGALDTDRIAVKPSPYAVEYLPGVRWVDPAPEHLQLLLARSLQGTGRFALVSGEGARTDPDWYLATDLQAFQVEFGPDGTPRATVRLRATVISDLDRDVRGARSFEATVPAAGTSAAEVVPAFDRALGEVLRAATDWTAATAR